jgi:cytochrome P450
MTDVAFDPDDLAFLADPHASYDALRPADVVRDPLGLSTISYAASESAFHDTALVPAIDHLLEHLGFGALWGSSEHTLTNTEGADHARLRRALTPWFTPKRVGVLRDRTTSLVASLLDAHEPGTPLDVMTELADVVPARVFGWMLGAGDEDDKLFAEWSKALILIFTARASMVAPVRAAKSEIATYVRELLAHKRAHPDDMLGTVLAHAEDRHDITDEDAIGLLEELLSAAVDNTANTVGCALHALATHPAAWTAARADVVAAVEECGRFEPAIRHTIKFAVEDTVVAGTPVAAGEFVTIRVAAAHRDPEVFDDPHRLDVARMQAKGRLDFGAGRHYCLGAALARMEIEEMLGGVVGRWSSAAVGDGAEMEVAANGHVFRLPLEVS